jgi:fimbrial chaperone protein
MRIFRNRGASLCAALGNSFVFLVLLTSVSLAANFKVSPVKVYLDKDRKTDVLNLTNEGEEELRVQIKAVQWSQDADGKDTYSETSDIFFYPKIIVLKGKETRVVRTGIKIPAAGKEKTYRLFISEIPKRKPSKGASITIAIRFGVPIFVKPLEEKPLGEITGMALSGGELGMSVKNSGNMHFMIKKIIISASGSSGKEVFSDEVTGWYLLSGASRLYTVPIPVKACTGMKTLDVAVETEGFTLNRRIDVDKSMCSQ